MTAGIPASRYADRLARAAVAVREAGVRGLLIGVGPELEWLTGYDAKALERLTLLVLPARGDPAIVVLRLEVAAAEAALAIGEGAVRVLPWAETADPYDQVWEALPGESATRLAVSDTLGARFLLRLQATYPGAAFELAGGILGALRRSRTRTRWSCCAPQVPLPTGPSSASRGRLVGRTEADVAAEVRARPVDEGHDSASFWIVASGPRSASPHHEPDDRDIVAGELLLLDIGGRRARLLLDITRTLW
ncbi:MAG: M24 family metallopeptidase [Chloroflexota bacterium]